MKRNPLLVTFLISFLFSFALLLAAFSVVSKAQGGGGALLILGINGGTLVLSLEISLLLAAVATILNYLENSRIKRKYEIDIERLLSGKLPEGERLKALAKHMNRIQSQIQSLSNLTNKEKDQLVLEERKRISRELHDSVSQELFAATMLLSAVSKEGMKQDAEQAAGQNALALKILHQAQSEMRALLLHLRPTDLTDKSLDVGLRELIDELRNKINSQLTYQLLEVHVSAEIEDHLFRMAQEILSNALRHAKAEHIDIKLMETVREVDLTIQDDGVGFDLSKEKQASYGLKNLEERALLLGGVCHIATQPGAGTKVEIRIPKTDDTND